MDNPEIYLLESLLKIIEELTLVALELGGTTSELKLLRSSYTLALKGRETSRKNSFGNQSDWHSQVEGVDS